MLETLACLKILCQWVCGELTHVFDIFCCKFEKIGSDVFFFNTLILAEEGFTGPLANDFNSAKRGNSMAKIILSKEEEKVDFTLLVSRLSLAASCSAQSEAQSFA